MRRVRYKSFFKNVCIGKYIYLATNIYISSSCLRVRVINLYLLFIFIVNTLVVFTLQIVLLSVNLTIKMLHILPILVVCEKYIKNIGL